MPQIGKSKVALIWKTLYTWTYAGHIAKTAMSCVRERQPDSLDFIFPYNKMNRNTHACCKQLFLWISAYTFFCSSFFISQIYTIALVFYIGSNKRSENPSSSKFVTENVQSSKVQLLADDLPFANSTFNRIYRKRYKMELCHEILPTLWCLEWINMIMTFLNRLNIQMNFSQGSCS